MNIRMFRGLALFSAVLLVLLIVGAPLGSAEDQAEDQARDRPVRKSEIEFLERRVTDLHIELQKLSRYTLDLKEQLDTAKAKLAQFEDRALNFAPVILHKPAGGGAARTISKWALMGPMPSAADQATQAKLERVLPVNFEQAGLKSVLDDLRKQGGFDIVVDWKALEVVGIEWDRPVTLIAANMTGQDVLETILDHNQDHLDPIKYRIDNGTIIISTQRKLDKHSELHAYDISSVVGFEGHQTEEMEEKLTDLMELIRNHAGDPLGWSDRGGETSAMAFFNGKLVIEAPRDVHFEVIEVLEKLD